MNNNKIRKDLGKMLKKGRVKANLTQAEVANKADITVNYYAMIERGEVNPSFTILHQISKVLVIKIEI